MDASATTVSSSFMAMASPSPSPLPHETLTPSSSRNTFHWLDYFVFSVFLMSSALIGAFFGWKGRNSSNNKEFLTGNRNLQMFPVVMSLAASFMSTNTILGVPAEVYTLGTQFAINCISFTVAIILSAEVFMPVFYDLNMTSVNEYLLLRFKSKGVRIVGSLGFVFGTMPYMAVVLYGPSLALSSVTPLSVTKSILVVGIICTFYTSIGGIKAVIWTDVLQCILMILGLVMVVAQVGFFDDLGFIEPFKIAGQQGRLNILEFDPNPYRNDTILSILSGTLVGWCGAYCISQTEVQRFCSTRSSKHAKKTLYWNLPPVMAIALLAIWCGVVIFAKYYMCDPVSMGIIKRNDQLMPYFVMETMSSIPGIPGLFTACVFSGALSTLSSGFNALAAVTWDDMLKNYFTKSSGRTTANITKIIAACYGLISLLLAFVVGRLGTVLQASIALSGAVKGPTFALFVLGIFFPFVNKKGAIIGTTVGIACSLFMAFGTIINVRPKAQLPIMTSNCSADILSVYGAHDPVKNILPWDYQPEGINKILHLSYFFVSVIGFLITIVLGVLVSLLTGSNHGNRIDVKLLSKYHWSWGSGNHSLTSGEKGGQLPLDSVISPLKDNNHHQKQGRARSDHGTCRMETGDTITTVHSNTTTTPRLQITDSKQSRTNSSTCI